MIRVSVDIYLSIHEGEEAASRELNGGEPGEPPPPPPTGWEPIPQHGHYILPEVAHQPFS